MNNYYNSTPYRLNLKLKKLNRNLSQDFDINRLYNNLNESMPLITNQFCSLKNRTKILNKALNKIPKINIETESSYYTNLSRSILTSPIKTKSTNYYNIPYKSPQPVLKPSNKIDNDFTNYQNISIYKNRINNNNGNPNRLRHNYSNSNYNLAYKRNNIYNDKMNNNNNNNRINKINNTNNQYFSFKNNNTINNYDNDKDMIEQKFKKLNQQIYEKDKIINEMKGIIDNTFDKLNKKNKENSMLQSEIMELKSRYNESNYNDFKNSNIQENSRYETNNNYNNEKEFIYPNKRKHKLNYIKNNDLRQRGNYNRYNFNGPEKADIRCEEIRKINKKMDNLLNKNENNIKKYEGIRKKYNYKINE